MKMSKKLSLAIVGMALFAGACSHSGDGSDASKKVSPITLAKAPAALVNGVHRDYPNATITRVDRDRTAVQLSYIVYITTSQGERRELRYDANGNRLGSR